MFSSNFSILIQFLALLGLTSNKNVAKSKNLPFSSVFFCALNEFKGGFKIAGSDFNLTHQPKKVGKLSGLDHLDECF